MRTDKPIVNQGKPDHDAVVAGAEVRPVGNDPLSEWLQIERLFEACGGEM